MPCSRFEGQERSRLSESWEEPQSGSSERGLCENFAHLLLTSPPKRLRPRTVVIRPGLKTASKGVFPPWVGKQDRRHFINDKDKYPRNPLSPFVMNRYPIRLFVILMGSSMFLRTCQMNWVAVIRDLLLFTVFDNGESAIDLIKLCPKRSS